MRTPAALRPALAAAAAVVLLTACGGDGDEDQPAATTSPSPTTGSAPAQTTAPDPEAAAFCDSVVAAFEDLSATLGTATPEQVAGQLPEVVDALEEVQAPPDIDADWQALVDALRRLGDTASGLDLTTPDGQQQYAAAEAELTQQVTGAQANVTSYVLANCSVASPSPTG